MAKVLVIDDDEDIATTTALMLKAGGHAVETELNEHQALARVESVRPDAIVLDVMFPGNADAGFQLSRQIRSVFPALPIIMVTSVNKYSSVRFSDKDIDESWLPVDRFVEKPIKKDVLLALVAELVKH